MTREFIYTKPFRDSWQRMGLDDTDIKQLEKILLENPQKGDVIQNSGGARKLRIQLEGRGKRGGGRVIYVDIFEKEKLYFLLAYPKNVQDNLTASQLKLISEIIDTIKRE